MTLEGSETSYTWTGLPILDENGNKYEYTVEELTELEDYSTIVSGQTIINSYKTEPEIQYIEVPGETQYIRVPGGKEIVEVPGPERIVEKIVEKEIPAEIDNINRIYGEDRIETAIELSKYKYDSAETIIVVRHDTYPDSLTASVLAAELQAPILLTPTDYLDPRVEDEIIRLGATRAYVIGGEGSVSANTYNEVNSLVNETIRLGGPSRYETSSLVAEEVVRYTGKQNIAVIASGEPFPDALSISSYAASNGYPILLVRKNDIPEEIEKVFEDLEIKETWLIGGANTVDPSLEAQLPGMIERIAGANRYATSVAIADKFFANVSKAYVASGEVWADALVVGPIAAGDKAPVILVARGGALEVVVDYFTRTGIDSLVIVGGPNTVPLEVEYQFSGGPEED